MAELDYRECWRRHRRWQRSRPPDQVAGARDLHAGRRFRCRVRSADSLRSIARWPILCSSPAPTASGPSCKLAFLTGIHDTIGVDLVNHCVNDILVQGARPLFFLDYLATGKLSPDVAEQIVRGMARGVSREWLRAARRRDRGDARFLSAAASTTSPDSSSGSSRERAIIDGASIVAGDILIALPSSGLHTNGYSLARRIVFDVLGLSIDSHVPELGETVASALMRPHRSYLPADWSAPRVGPDQGHGPHHRRRHHRKPATGSARRAPLHARSSELDRSAALHLAPTGGRNRRARRCSAPSTWASV